MDKVNTGLIDEIPEPLKPVKTTTQPKENMFRTIVYKNQHKHMRRWKHLK